jgi:urease accessory protein UreF
MHPEIAEATRRAAALTADQLTSSVPAIDIAGMRHERLYSRLYMS